MHMALLNSLLELAHATSENLAFAHRKDVDVSYGEETITETNLLELRRRHPAMIQLKTFGKPLEAKNGADWEWHIIGRARSFGMRVQAKRLQQDNVLKIRHIVKSSGKEQIDLLIEDAKMHQLMPVYCLYSSEQQRQKWKVSNQHHGITSPFEFGCLLASAHKVRAKNPKSLAAIEADCVPWHYLADRRRFRRLSEVGIVEDETTTQFLNAEGILQFPVPETGEADSALGDIFPTIDELNNFDIEMPGRAGIFERRGDAVRPEISEDIFHKRGISRLIEIDVRDVPFDDRGPETPPDARPW